MPDVAYVALGSNLGDRHQHLQAALDHLARLPRTRLVRAGAVEETAPFGPVEQGPFLNQMVMLETELAPRDLLEALQQIERARGRVRRERWGPRTLDLDIVAFEHGTVDEPGLQVPHRGLPDREFWQRQLAALKLASMEGAP